MNLRNFLGLLLLFTPHTSVLKKWFPNLSHGVSLTRAQTIISVGPFLEDDDLTLCIDSLEASDFDFNGRVDRTEFNIAVAQWTDGSIPALTSQSSLPLQAVFNQFSCTILRFCDESRQVCCDEGSDQYIPLDDEFGALDEKRAFFRLCASTDNAILITTETFPSPLPSSAPSSVPSSFPTILSSSSPTIVASDVPSIMPSLTPSLTPSQEPSGAPSGAPSYIPSNVPSYFPSEEPSIAPTISSSTIPSLNPTSVPSVLSSNMPSGSPSTLSSIVPSSEPSNLSSLTPSISHVPTQIPSTSPSMNPSLSSSQNPSTLPSQTPTVIPSQNPSVTPTISSAPTRFGRMQITLTYGLRTAGFNAESIRNAEDNSIAADLIAVVTGIILSIIGQESDQDTTLSIMKAPPKPNFESIENSLAHESEDADKSMDRMKLSRMQNIIQFIMNPPVEEVYDVYNPGKRLLLRNLVSYLPEVPAFHQSIIQDVCDPFNARHECVIISTVVVVYTEEGENRGEIRSRIVSGFNDALNDGTFLQALMNQ